MKAAILNLAVAASLATAQPHQHGRFHHQKRDGSPVEKRDVATSVTYVPAYVTKYVLDDQDVTPEDAKAGLDNGLYIVVGETTPTFTPPPPPPASTSSSSQDGGIFIQQAATTSSPSPSSTPASSTQAASSSASSGFNSGATGVTADFPSGKVPCSEFPSDYGAVALSWLGLGGWSGIQRTDYSVGASVISFIETAINGATCQSGEFCSYACPEGYVQSQWPEAQGATGQSVGGLYCNADGFLELTRSAYSTLCQKGLGNIKIVNKMQKNVAVCRTQYPGTENMVIPLDAEPNGTFDLANIDSADYYEWDGKATTLQYYVNQAGVSVKDGCVWDCATNHDECGNWAPTIIGTGRAADGITYLSVFPNLPTSHANLNFNIKITGDVSMECELNGGQYSVSSTGCTVCHLIISLGVLFQLLTEFQTGVKPGGTAYIEFSN